MSNNQKPQIEKAAEISLLPKPYKTGTLAGISIVKTLLHPSIKSLIDIMAKTKGCYIGISEGSAHLYIDNHPVIAIKESFLNNIKILLADDVRQYHDLTEYRLLAERYNQILTYYL